METGVLTPSQVDNSMIDSFIKVQGKITLVHKDPGGLALWLSDDKGKVGIRIETKVWDGMAPAEQAQYERGKTVTAEGMLVLAGGSELFIVLGVAPPDAKPGQPPVADVEVVTAPINLSKNPQGFRGWPWPRIFIHNDKLAVIYWGVVDGWKSSWITRLDGDRWSQPVEVPLGTTFIVGDRVYFLHNWKYTPDMGNVGVAITITDSDYRVEKEIVVDTRPCVHGTDKNPNPKAVLDSRGNLHITWESDTEVATDIYYAKFDGESLSPTVCISNSPEQGSLNNNVTIDGNGVIYVTWTQLMEGTGTFGGSRDIFYSFSGNGAWSEPNNLTNTPDWDEFATRPLHASYDIGEAYLFYDELRGAEPGATYFIVLNRDKFSKEKVDMSFCDIALVSAEDKIHAIYGGYYPEQRGEITLSLKLLYNYFDGESWYGGRGVDILSQEFMDNSERQTLDISPERFDDISIQIFLDDGSKDLAREIHPYTIYKDGLIHVVFECNQRGTYDAYYMAIRPQSP
jgi:hypothetical protein